MARLDPAIGVLEPAPDQRRMPVQPGVTEWGMRRREFIALLGGASLTSTIAQARQPYRLGYLALLPGENATLMKLMLDRLRELGYRDAQDLVVEYRSAEGHPERMTVLASELVALQPDILVAGFGTVAAKAAKAATGTIPIVFTTVGDPIGAGLVANLARPGGNITGLTDQAADIGGKRLGLLREAVPGKTSFAVLMNPDTPYSALAFKEIESAAGSSVSIRALEARTPDEVVQQLAGIENSGIAGLLVLGDPLTIGLGSRIADLALHYRLPSIHQFKESVQAGGLMSYGPDRRHLYGRAAEYVDKLLKGAKPADLPVEQPTTFELVINLKTAKALDLIIPQSLLARADEVIE
jgi:putative ABC transport system substrate-binding protein